MEKLYHQGVMRTELDDCQFVCITQSDYYKILNDREENQKIVKDDNGQVVLVSEFDGSIKNGKHFITLTLKEAGESTVCSNGFYADIWSQRQVQQH